MGSIGHIPAIVDASTWASLVEYVIGRKWEMPDKATGDRYYPKEVIADFEAFAIQSLGKYDRCLELMRAKYPKYDFTIKQIRCLANHLKNRGHGKRDGKQRKSPEEVETNAG